MNRLGLDAGNPMHRAMVTPEYKCIDTQKIYCYTLNINSPKGLLGTPY